MRYEDLPVVFVSDGAPEGSEIDLDGLEVEE